MRLVMILFALLTVGCSGQQRVQTQYQLTADQRIQKIELLTDRGILGDTSLLIGRTESDEEELLSLADRTAVQGTEKWYGFDVPRHDRPFDYDGPVDEGDGSLRIHIVDGVIVEADYVVAEY